MASPIREIADLDNEALVVIAMDMLETIRDKTDNSVIAALAHKGCEALDELQGRGSFIDIKDYGR